MIRRLFYGPGDWLAERTSARGRRAFGFWNIVFAALFAIPFGGKVMYVTILSIIALFPNVTSETPVEYE